MGPAIDADIRLLTVEDLDGALALSSTAGWNQRLEDWLMLLRLAPAGSFAAVANGRIVGTAIGIDYGRFAWIAMMLVDPASRGQGLGARLLEAAMGAVPSDHPIRLDATPMGRPLYQRYGFEDEAMLSRHVAEAAARRQPPVEDSKRWARRVRALTAADLPAVAALDRAVFGANRRVLLEWALEGASQYAHVVDASAGVQYCVGRPGRLFDQVGPVVADNDEDAKMLVSAALQSAQDRAVVADVFDARGGFAEWLGQCGFKALRPLFRMCRAGGPDSAGDHAVSRGDAIEYTIFGPEFA
jgi:GNAT superfamily N-acetyltransferase